MNHEEKKRQRRAKRKAKQTRSERNLLPRFIACHFLEGKPHPTADHLLDAFECAQNRRNWLELPYRETDGKPCQCWLNVEKAVSLWGGKMVCGWSFRIDPLDGFKNCLAAIEAIPHAVWSDEEGNLYEVSPDCRGAYFLPSVKVRPYLAINVGFTDNEAQAETYRPPDPFLMPFSRNFYVRVGKNEQ
jgi:hypothetical protein